MSYAITSAALKTAGYSPFPGNPGQGWQKIVRTNGSHENAYFINFFVRTDAQLVEAQVKFFAGEDANNIVDAEFDVRIRCFPRTTINQVESFCSRFYDFAGCIPDVDNN